MLPHELVLNQIQHHETTPVPFSLTLEANIAAKVDAYYGSTLWRQSILNDILRVRAIDADKYQKVNDNHDIDGFGSWWRTDLMPRHLEKPALTEPSLMGFSWPEPEIFFDLQARTHAIATREKYPDHFIVAHTGWGLFERTWTLRGFTDVLVDVIAEPNFYEELLDRIVETQLAFIAESATLPVDGIMFSDDWGDQRGVILGPERWRRFIKPRIARLYEAVHKHGLFTLSHCCGNVSDIIPDLIEVGLDALESIQPEAMNPYELKRRWGKDITFWGGLGSQSTLAFGSPAEVRAEVRRLAAEMSIGGGYILAPAKTLMDSMPVENAVAAVEAFRQVREV